MSKFDGVGTASREVDLGWCSLVVVGGGPLFDMSWIEIKSSGLCVGIVGYSRYSPNALGLDLTPSQTGGKIVGGGVASKSLSGVLSRGLTGGLAGAGRCCRIFQVARFLRCPRPSSMSSGLGAGAVMDGEPGNSGGS